MPGPFYQRLENQSLSLCGDALNRLMTVTPDAASAIATNGW